MTTAADVQWRHPTKADLPAWAALMAAAEAADQVGENWSEGDLDDEFDAPYHEVENAWFGTAPDGSLVAFGWARGRPEADAVNRVFLWGAVRPDVRRRGIGGVLLARLEERGRAIHADLHPGLDGVLEVHCGETNTGLRRLAERAGYEPLRYWFDMRHPLGDAVPDVHAPDGLVLRRYAPALAEQVRLAHNDAFRDHWGSSPIPQDDWRHTTVGRYFRPELSFVVLDGAEVAGYLITQFYAADAEAQGFSEAWVDTLGTRRAWRQRGVAQALLGAALRAYRDGGYDFGSLGVDADNPSGALRLYEKLGFATVRSSISYGRPV